MPFTEDGISPDLIINPHAFPSRMTIGMLIESMAGKTSALSGEFADSTPFKFHENLDMNAVEFFGEKLRGHGFNYLGNESFYSGTSGEPFEADIFMGVVYYQRLRHMVSDKYQVYAPHLHLHLLPRPLHIHIHITITITISRPIPIPIPIPTNRSEAAVPRIQ